MKIGIIGAGNIGGALTRRLIAAGHDVHVANSRGPETLRDLAAETGAKAVAVREAARDKEVVIVSIPLKNVVDLPKDLFAGVPDDVVVVDTGNYYPRQRDGRIDEIGFDAIDAGTLDESWRQQPGAPVYTKDYDAAGVRRALSEAQPERTEAWRATPKSPGTYTSPA